MNSEEILSCSDKEVGWLWDLHVGQIRKARAALSGIPFGNVQNDVSRKELDQSSVPAKKIFFYSGAL